MNLQVKLPELFGVFVHLLVELPDIHCTDKSDLVLAKACIVGGNLIDDIPHDGHTLGQNITAGNQSCQRLPVNGGVYVGHVDAVNQILNLIEAVVKFLAQLIDILYRLVALLYLRTLPDTEAERVDLVFQFSSKA